MIHVERTILMMPKAPPRKPPIRGPKMMEAMITGMCIVVALIGPKGMNPRKGTDAKRIKIPRKNAVKTKSKVAIFSC